MPTLGMQEHAPLNCALLARTDAMALACARTAASCASSESASDADDAPGGADTGLAGSDWLRGISSSAACAAS